MKYEVLLTQGAQTDLRAIFRYIADVLKSPQSAENQLDRLEKAILALDDMPERFRIYDKEPWQSRNLRIMPVDNYLIFYVPRHESKTVIVMRVLYGGQDVDRQLKQS